MKPVFSALAASAVLLTQLLGAPAAAAEASAANTDTPAAPDWGTAAQNKSELWVNVGGFSRHFARDKGYNESNFGVGIEYRTAPDLSYMAGTYYNSVRKTTYYAAANWQPLSIGPWKIGASLGVMNGYPAVSRGGTFFAALPLATYEGKTFGVNLGLIPTVGKVDGAVIVQFKFRVN